MIFTTTTALKPLLYASKNSINLANVEVLCLRFLSDALYAVIRTNFRTKLSSYGDLTVFCVLCVMTDQVEAELREFSPYYRKQFSVAWFNKVEDDLEQNKQKTTQLLKQRVCLTTPTTLSSANEDIQVNGVRWRALPLLSQINKQEQKRSIHSK